jgi:serine/threonine protein kinase
MRNTRMQAVKTPDTEPIPGYRLVEPLGSGGYGEVWKCVAPGGLMKAIKFVAASDSVTDVGCAATQELQALQHIKSVRHPFLLSIERVEVLDGELVIVMELADRNLNDLLNEYQKRGQPGIPRNELICYLRDAAEALDVLNLEHGLQHLDVKPRNLFLVGRHIKVADFGLVNSLAEMSGNSPRDTSMGVATPVYSSPESFLGRITLFSDQYSLAISYCELLTGTPPFNGKNFRQLALQHTGMEPDLSQLPEHDRLAVARALAKEPTSRFPSCLDFVSALEQGCPITAPAPTPSRPVPILKAPTRLDIKVVKLSKTPVMNAGTLPAAPSNNESSRRSGNEPENGPVAPESNEQLSSYQFLECLARLPVGEVWRARNSAGRNCLIKLVFGCQAAEEAGGTGAVVRLRSLSHEALQPFSVIRDGANRIALVVDERDGSLADRLTERRSSGLHGIPREELLNYLWPVAEALDELYEKYNLSHLMLNPRSFILDAGQVHIADFGLAELIWRPAGLEPGKLNSRYSAPELLENQFAPTSDQYSLALIYGELLTGIRPFGNLSPRQLASARSRGQPSLDLLSALDRAVVSRALDPDPEKRYRTCTDFVTALDRASIEVPKPGRSSTAIHCITAPTPAIVPASGPLPLALTSAESQQFVQKLLGEAMGGAGVRELKGFRFRVVPGALMEHHFTARFLQGTLPIKLEGFRQHWLGKVISSSDNEVLYHISPPVKGLQRILGRIPTLQLHVTHGNRPDAAPTVGISVTLQALPRGEHLLEELGPRIFDSIRQFLQAVPDRRREERFRLGKPLRVLPVFDSREVGEGIVAQTLDISQAGLGFYLPCRPASTDLLLEVGSNPGTAHVLAARIARSERCSDGRYLIGVSFDAAKPAND